MPAATTGGTDPPAVAGPGGAGSAPTGGAATIVTGGIPSHGDDGTVPGILAPERPDRRVSLALKKHIVRERQRKKEEHEAEIEEERLRKEREARKKQDDMTLGETREQIQQLEVKLTKLKEEKHQLFLQLKKVLNEDDNRKKQIKDEMVLNMCNVGQQHFPPPNMSQGNPNTGRPPLSSHILNKAGGGMKRGRSPSPTGPHGGGSYMHHPHHKQPHTSPYHVAPHKMEEGRGRDVTRAVLWNKPQYGSAGGGSSFHTVPQNEQRTGHLLYAAPIYHHHAPPKQIHHPSSKETSVVMGIGEPYQPNYLPPMPSGIAPVSAAPQGPSSLIAVRHAPQQQLMSGPPPMHQGVGPLQHSNVQNTKPGGITSGYPVRQQNPSMPNPNIYPNRHRY